MIRGNNIKKFLRGCSDHWDQLLCLFELKKLPWPYGCSLGWKIFFSMAINIMSLAVWLGEDRKCSAALVGLDLLLGLPMVRRCSLNRSFKRRFVLCIVDYSGCIESCR